MVLVIICTGMFLAGVVILGLLQFVLERWGRGRRLPMDVIEPALTGVGFLITIPFVSAILIRANGFDLTTVIIAGASLFCAAVAFAVAFVRWVRRGSSVVLG